MATLAEEMLKESKTPEQIELEKQELIKAEEAKLAEEAKVEEEEKKKRGRPAKPKEEPATVEVTKDKEEETEEEFNEAEVFYKELTDITGDDITEIEFGNIDPLSPQGVAKLIEYKSTKIRSELEEYLASVAPLEYEAMLMRIEGKDPSELYDKTGFIEYDKIEIAEDDIDIQKQLIFDNLSSKGLNEIQINRLIKGIENEGELFDEANKAKEELHQNQLTELEKTANENKIAKQQQQEKINNFSTLVNDTIGKGEVGNFVIPEKDKSDFYEFVRTNVIYNNGEFYVSNKIDQDNYDKIMKTLYFQYKGGDIKSLVEKEAKKQNVTRLRTVANATKSIGGDDLTKNDSKKSGAKHWSEELGMNK